MTHIEVFSDGSATTADKAGGWGSVILFDGILHKELSGHMESATNNDAELAAAIEGLNYVWEYVEAAEIFSHSVTLISDSEIVLNWASGKYRFKQLDKIDQYERLRFLMDHLKAKTQWVKGHSGNPWNSLCDKLANAARKGVSNPLDKSGLLMDTKIGTKKLGVASVWYKDVLKVIDFETGIIENYSRELHGKRGSIIEIREGKDR